MKSRGNRSPLRIDLLIFDMDGVLVDVSRSYRQVIQQTVRIYFETCLGLKKGLGNLVTKEEISLFKSIGGFNNDWELTSALILCLLSISGIPPSARRKSFSAIGDVVQHLKTRSSPYHARINGLLEKKRLSLLVERIQSCGGGLRGVRLALRETKGASWDGWVYGFGDIDKENLVKRIFQELYLGRQFAQSTHLRPLFHKGRGYYLRERLLIPRNMLTALRKRVCMGIASGRPRFEALLALKRFRLLSLFDPIVTLEECEEEERRILKRTGARVKRTKPHPYSILRVARETGAGRPRCAYMGDVVDDMYAARAAKKTLDIAAIGFLGGQANKKAAKEALFEAGADRVIESPEEILRLIG
jgi:HAD superfamily hydrolase (TIGR01548 family)